MKYIENIPQHKYPWLSTLYSLVISLQPSKIVEYGTALGGTAITMALALRELEETCGHRGHVFTYDTFENQSKGEIGSNPNYQAAIGNIQTYRPIIGEYVTVDRGDFFKFNEDPKKSFDLLYFDIDNDGDKVLEMYEGCKSHIDKGSVVLFEGGSEARDSVEWMSRLGKTRITTVQSAVGYKLLTPNQKYSCSIIYNPNIYYLNS